MSTVSSPSESPAIQPMHNASQAAVVQQPLAPVGNTKGVFNGPGQATKAMLAKRLVAKGANPKYISPTDKMMTPCTAKINQSKQKHFTKAKPVQMFKVVDSGVEEKEEDGDLAAETKADAVVLLDDEENPF